MDDKRAWEISMRLVIKDNIYEILKDYINLLTYIVEKKVPLKMRMDGWWSFGWKGNEWWSHNGIKN